MATAALVFATPLVLAIPVAVVIFACFAWRTKEGDLSRSISQGRRPEAASSSWQISVRVAATARRLLDGLLMRPSRDSRPSEFVWQLVAMQQSGAEEETRQWGVCRVQLLVWLLCVQRLQAIQWRRNRGHSATSLGHARGLEVVKETGPVLPQMVKSRIEAFVGPGWQCGAVTAPYARAIARAADLCSKADALSAQARAARQVDAALTAITKDIIDPQVLDAARKGRHRCECFIDTTILSPEAVSAVSKASSAVKMVGKRGMAQVVREHLISCGYRVSLSEVPLDAGFHRCNCGEASAPSRSIRFLEQLNCSRRSVGRCRAGSCRPQVLHDNVPPSWTTWLGKRLINNHWLGYMLGHHDCIALERLKVSLRW